MNPPSIVFFLVFFLTISLATPTDDLIDQTCKQFTKERDLPSIMYKFCFDALTSDPKSHGADLTTLGKVAFDITKKNATDTLSLVNGLLKDKKVEKGTRAALEDCSELYSDAIDELNQATTALNEKRYIDVNRLLGVVQTDADTCGEGFRDLGISYPLVEKRNDITMNLTAIGFTIWEMLSKK